MSVDLGHPVPPLAAGCTAVPADVFGKPALHWVGPFGQGVASHPSSQAAS